MATSYNSIGVSRRTLDRLKKLKEQERKRIGLRFYSWDAYLANLAKSVETASRK